VLLDRPSIVSRKLVVNDFPQRYPRIVQKAIKTHRLCPIGAKAVNAEALLPGNALPQQVFFFLI